MRTTVIGGAMLPHAPQFFTMPDTEDRKTVEQVRAVAADIGNKLKALKPDLWIIFSNDHAEQFFLGSTPPFTVHVGGEDARDRPADTRTSPSNDGGPLAHVITGHLRGSSFSVPQITR